jgi:hypothetical protein
MLYTTRNQRKARAERGWKCKLSMTREWYRSGFIHPWTNFEAIKAYFLRWRLSVSTVYRFAGNMTSDKSYFTVPRYSTAETAHRPNLGHEHISVPRKVYVRLYRSVKGVGANRGGQLWEPPHRLQWAGARTISTLAPFTYAHYALQKCLEGRSRRHPAS